MTLLGRRRLWIGLFVSVIFVLGMAAGAGLTRMMRFGPPFGPRRPPPPPSPAMMADRLTRDLSLTPEQRTQLEVVLRQGSERLERFHAETGDAYGKLRKELDADIERLLTPEQQVKFRARRPGPRDGRPPRDGGPPRGGPPPPDGGPPPPPR
jgi:Spy/CpxP family protein refolding chaperone